MNRTFQIRPFQPQDGPGLLQLFRETIRVVNCRDYTAEQIAAWASNDIDVVAWTARFAGRFVPVAHDGDLLLGFAELEADGHIDRFYVSASAIGHGIGKQLMHELLAEARRQGMTSLFVEASITARPFFEARGFTTIAEQTVLCRGVAMNNFRMSMDLPT